MVEVVGGDGRWRYIITKSNICMYIYIYIYIYISIKKDPIHSKDCFALESNTMQPHRSEPSPPYWMVTHYAP